MSVANTSIQNLEFKIQKAFTQSGDYHSQIASMYRGK